MGMFSDGTGDYNRELKAQRDRVLREELTTGAIGRSFRDFQGLFAPMLGQMGQAATVGANMDTQSMQAALARQGLGGTGLGLALGGGLRSGANFAVNNLRAQMAMEALSAAQNLRMNRANTLMGAAGGMMPEQGMGPYWLDKGLQMGGTAMQGASLMGGGGAVPTPGTGPGTGVGGYMPLGI